MEKIKWEFASTGGGPREGIHNPMISHFTGNFNYHLAREIIQNSLDAKMDENSPVIVKFSLENIKKNDFPGFAEFNEILQDCIRFWPKENTDTQDFLNKAKVCMGNSTIPVLKCSDFNTIGLTGSDDDLKGSWFNLVRSKGASSKFEGEGGSFGIGKGAPFAASDLRVIFYYTKDKNERPIFQGIAELVSFKKDGDVKRGSGSYGDSGYSSVRRPDDIPEFYSRKAVDPPGLDVYIMGFKKTEKWKDELAQSVLRNFWFSLFKKELVVEIGDIKIDKNSLERMLIKYFLDEKLKDDIEPTGNPYYYYQAVKDGEIFTKKLSSLGDVEFYFKELSEHMNYVAMLRKPLMVVFSKAYRFPGGNYCGVFICKNNVGNQILRKMEPPAHNKWEPESYGKDGVKILNEIHECIREILKSKQSIKPSGKLEIPDLYKYLPFDEGTEEGNGKGSGNYTEKEAEEESSREMQMNEVQEKGAIVKPYKPTINNKTEKTGLGGGLRGKGKRKKNKKKDGIGFGGESPEKKALTSKEIAITSFINKNITDGFEYLFNIKSDKDRKCSFQIMAVADDDSKDKITILKAFDENGNNVHVAGNRISKLDVAGINNTKLYVQIKTFTKIALKTNAYEL